jgi:chemotaxis protein MotA
MGAIDGPPAEIGHKVGAALVGTFLGVLLSYGFVGPLATALQFRVDDASKLYGTIKHVLMSFERGIQPSTAVEYARRAIPFVVRPTFAELEKVIRGKVSK